MNIKELRIKSGLSQQGLSDKTGIPKSRIGQWEIGKGKPKTEDYEVLINFFTELGLVNTTELDVGAAIKEIKAIGEVTLSAVAELLARANNQSSTVVKEQLQDLVNKRLNS